MFSKKPRVSRAQLFHTLKAKSDQHSSRLSITLMLKARSLEHQLSSTKSKSSPTIRINLWFLFMLVTELTKFYSLPLLRNLLPNLKRDSKKLFFCFPQDASNHAGLNKIESSKDPTAELSQLSIPLSLMNSSSQESSLATEPESDLTEPASPKLLWINLSNISWKTELALLELLTES